MSTKKEPSLTEVQEDNPKGVSRPDVDDDAVFSYEEQRKIIRRLDYRLITTTGSLYAISLIDRSNLSFAAVAGMTRDLDMLVSYRYVRCPTEDVVSLSCPEALIAEPSSPNSRSLYWFSSSPTLSANPLPR